MLIQNQSRNFRLYASFGKGAAHLRWIIFKKGLFWHLERSWNGVNYGFTLRKWPRFCWPTALSKSRNPSKRRDQQHHDNGLFSFARQKDHLWLLGYRASLGPFIDMYLFQFHLPLQAFDSARWTLPPLRSNLTPLSGVPPNGDMVLRRNIFAVPFT